MFVVFPVAAITSYLWFNRAPAKLVVALREEYFEDHHKLPSEYVYRYVHPRDSGVVGKKMSITHPKTVKLIHNVLGGSRPVQPRDYYNRKPVAVGYISGNHLNELKINMPTWFPHFNRVVIYYLDKNERHRRHFADVFGDKIEIIDFPLQDYPNPINKTKSYSFKMLVMADAVRRFGFVALMDACVRYPTNFTASKIKFDDKYFEGKYFDEKKGGACVKFLGPGTRVSMPHATHPGIQEYLPHIQSEFKKLDGYMRVKQLQAGFIIIMGTSNCFKNYLIPGYVCALYNDCIDPPGAVKYKSGVKGTHTHMWDQSMANLLAGNMYGFMDFMNKKHRPTHEYHTPISGIFCRSPKCLVRDRLTEFCNQRKPVITEGTCEGQFE